MAEPDLKTRPSHVLEDPSAKAVASVYARAYLDAAQVGGEAQPLDEFTSFVDEVLTPYPEFARMLTSEMTTRDEKLGLIERVVQPRASAPFTNFLKVLARHERLELLPLILGEARTEHERRSGQRRVQVTSAVELTDNQLGRIQGRLKESLPFEPIVEPRVDASLLGGLVIRVGDTVYDSSLRTRLKTLRNRLRERYLHEIQSERDRFSSAEGN